MWLHEVQELISQIHRVSRCPICQRTMRSPSRTECGHVFCNECITKALREVSRKCPICNVAITNKRKVVREATVNGEIVGSMLDLLHCFNRDIARVQAPESMQFLDSQMPTGTPPLLLRHRRRVLQQPFGLEEEASDEEEEPEGQSDPDVASTSVCSVVNETATLSATPSKTPSTMKRKISFSLFGLGDQKRQKLVLEEPQVVEEIESGEDLGAEEGLEGVGETLPMETAPFDPLADVGSPDLDDTLPYGNEEPEAPAVTPSAQDAEAQTSVVSVRQTDAQTNSLVLGIRNTTSLSFPAEDWDAVQLGVRLKSAVDKQLAAGVDVPQALQTALAWVPGLLSKFGATEQTVLTDWKELLAKLCGKRFATVETQTETEPRPAKKYTVSNETQTDDVDSADSGVVDQAQPQVGPAPTEEVEVDAEERECGCEVISRDVTQETSSSQKDCFVSWSWGSEMSDRALVEAAEKLEEELKQMRPWTEESVTRGPPGSSLTSSQVEQFFQGDLGLPNASLEEAAVVVPETLEMDSEERMGLEEAIVVPDSLEEPETPSAPPPQPEEPSPTIPGNLPSLLSTPLISHRQDQWLVDCSRILLCPSGFDQDKLEMISGLLGRINERFGCSWVRDWSPLVTHLIVFAPDNDWLSQRTLKYFQALAAKQFIVKWTWLTQSERLGKLLNPEDFEIRGDFQTKVSYGPQQARQRQSPPLFSRLRVFFWGDFKCSKEKLEGIMRMSGGEVCGTLEALREGDPLCQRLILVDSRKPKFSEWTVLEKQTAVPIISVDWFLDSLSIQKIQSYDDYYPY